MMIGQSGRQGVLITMQGGRRGACIGAQAGHAHAAVLVVPALVGQILADAADLGGVGELVARNGIWLAAILFPLGFFLSSAGEGAERPNRLIVLLYADAGSLSAAVIALGIGLLQA
jgi:hypothetical protein